MDFINPLKIPAIDLPLFVLSDNTRSFLGWGIKSHTKGNWGHIMIMISPGKVATQTNVFKEISIEAYMKPYIRLKFWQPTKITYQVKNQVTQRVLEDLTRPWWERSYDYLGIAGHLFRLRFLNNPFTYYCSERTKLYAEEIPYLRGKIPYKPSPVDMNQAFINTPQMRLYGYWDKEFSGG